MISIYVLLSLFSVFSHSAMFENLKESSLSAFMYSLLTNTPGCPIDEETQREILHHSSKWL